MSIVFVNDWSGYGGGIFDTFENALEDMAILAVDKGIEGHQEYVEGIEYLAKPLSDVGFGGTRQDRNIYAIVRSDDYTTFSIRTHDTKTRPGKTSKTVDLVSERMCHPAWAVQRALYELATENVVGPEAIREELVEDLEDQIARVLNDSASPVEALATIRGNGIPPLAVAIHKELFPVEVDDATAFLDALPERAAGVFDEIVAKAFPDVVREEPVTP